MTTIKKAIVKSYDPAAHKAAVQIAGSLAVWLETVPVATDIPAVEVQAGRECTVIFFTDDNPDDAVIATIQGTHFATTTLLIALVARAVGTARRTG